MDRTSVSGTHEPSNANSNTGTDLQTNESTEQVADTSANTKPIASNYSTDERPSSSCACGACSADAISYICMALFCASSAAKTIARCQTPQAKTILGAHA
jgi:hypothetical protein